MVQANETSQKVLLGTAGYSGNTKLIGG
jgi:hypothetical protein